MQCWRLRLLDPIHFGRAMLKGGFEQRILISKRLAFERKSGDYILLI
jgi:hypothetical protein